MISNLVVHGQMAHCNLLQVIVHILQRQSIGCTKSTCCSRLWGIKKEIRKKNIENIHTKKCMFYFAIMTMLSLKRMLITSLFTFLEVCWFESLWSSLTLSFWLRPLRPISWLVMRWLRVPTVVSFTSLRKLFTWEVGNNEIHDRNFLKKVHLAKYIKYSTDHFAVRKWYGAFYLRRCSTPTSSASSAPISVATCSKVLLVGVPSSWISSTTL